MRTRANFDYIFLIQPYYITIHIPLREENENKEMNEIEKMKGYLQLKEYYRECNEHLVGIGPDISILMEMPM